MIIISSTHCSHFGNSFGIGFSAGIGSGIGYGLTKSLFSPKEKTVTISNNNKYKVDSSTRRTIRRLQEDKDELQKENNKLKQKQMILEERLTKLEK